MSLPSLSSVVLLIVTFFLTTAYCDVTEIVDDTDSRIQWNGNPNWFQHQTKANFSFAYLDWSYDGSLTSTQKDGAGLQFPFVGKTIAIRAYVRPLGATILVSIDGGPGATVNTTGPDNQTNPIVWTSDELDESKSHVITAVHIGGKWMSIDTLLVTHSANGSDSTSSSGNPNSSNSKLNSRRKMSPGVIAGIVLSTVFVLGIVLYFIRRRWKIQQKLAKETAVEAYPRSEMTPAGVSRILFRGIPSRSAQGKGQAPVEKSQVPTENDERSEVQAASSSNVLTRTTNDDSQSEFQQPALLMNDPPPEYTISGS